MHFPVDKPYRNLIVFAIGLGATVGPACPQTVRVDVAPAHALAFDPDKAMGSSMDILPVKDFDTVYSEPIIKESLSAGWGPITYRQNTELTIGAWHWNPKGTWSDAKSQSGYFVGGAQPGDSLRQSFGYKLPHRGSTRSDAGQNEYSRITDGDGSSYWKSNPYLADKFTGEPEALHPQWVIIDFAMPQDISALEIAWANPCAKKYVGSIGTARGTPYRRNTRANGSNFRKASLAAARAEPACNAWRTDRSPRALCAFG
jgi:hypothetical protein